MSTQLQSLTDASLQDNIRVERALVDELKPRDISKEQLATIASALKGRIGTIYLYPLGDPEASQYSHDRKSRRSPCAYLPQGVTLWRARENKKHLIKGGIGLAATFVVDVAAKVVADAAVRLL